MNFTHDWFSAHIPHWERHVEQLADRPCQIVEVGTYQGLAAVWMARRLLRHPGSQLLCIDLPASPGWEWWRDNMAELGNSSQVVGCEGSSHEILPKLARDSRDLIYIDGGHHGSDVIRDACNAWPLLKAGGILVFDDYLWNSPGVPPNKLPGPAIDYFHSLHRDEIEVLEWGYQVFLRKR